jgi:DNA-binding LytR/AlgR family response regulator
MTQELASKRILVIEDEPLISEDLTNEITAEGAKVIGPVGTVEAALDVIASIDSLDGAILDIKLMEKMSFQVADVLAAHHVPFVFWTGYPCDAVIPAHHAKVTCLEKPAKRHEVSRVLKKLLTGRSTGAPI